MSDYSPELIPSCKETKLIRFQSKVVGLGPPARRHSMRIINLALLVLCILSGIVGVAYLGFNPLVRSLVLKRLVLSNTSDTFHIWEDPPISPHFKVYFFNLTNPEQVFNGTEKPNLVEIGPYSYTQKWLKQNVTWNPNGTISYKTRKIFTFSPEKSCAGCVDVLDNITTLNVPAISAYYQNRGLQWYSPTRHGLNWGLGLGYKPWLTRTVHELLWGYDEPLFTAAQTFLPDPPPFDRFGLFLLKNSSKESDLGEYSMYTGEGDPYRLANIHSYNGKTELNYWNESQCNKVHGSDGASFNPYIKKSDTLWFFNDQLCRAMPLVYEKTIDQGGLPGLRFVPREDVFMSSEKYPQNSCFGGEDRLMGDGVFDVTICQFDAPIVLSWPHFLGAESKFSDAVTGLSPDKEKHGFWFDIQDVTGTTLSAKAKLQVNMLVPKLDIYTDLSKINTTLIPICWMDEGIDELGPELIGVLSEAVIQPAEWRQIILYVWLGIFLTLFVLSLVALGRCILNRSKVERMREQVENMIHSQMQQDQNNCQLIQPMLGAYLESSDSSRSTTATHSRTSSEGVTPPYAVNPVVNPMPGSRERPKTLLPYKDTPATEAPSTDVADTGTNASQIV